MSDDATAPDRRTTDEPQQGDTGAREMIFAPWTDEQVEVLNLFQQAGVFHPFTCANRDDGKHQDYGVLVATRDGWTCTWCDYTQDWAHAAMASREFIESQQTVMRGLFSDGR